MQRLICFLTVLSVASLTMAQTREELVRGDKAKVEAEGFWIYNDIPRAFEEARKTGKPIVVVLRCLPCHECVKLDDELVDTDPVIRPLLEKFVCARQVSTNGLDLSLFQYDTDQSFAVFFLNADKTIYGRFGTRSHRTDWVEDVSLEGLGKALQAALDLHSDYDEVKASLAGKRGAPMEFASPEKYPSLKGKFTDALNYKGDVVKSCIHCHQIGDAQRDFHWKAKKPIPDRILWPYPHPKSVGLVMNPDELATVQKVLPNTPAASAGLRSGDSIASFDGQPMLSTADVQWVLHNVDPDGANVPIVVIRAGRSTNLSLSLGKGWRQKDDLSWRVSTWGLRRMAAGGLVLNVATVEEGRPKGLSPDAMALLVRRAGKYGPHGTARRVGFREGDIITSFDGRHDLMTEQELLTYVATSKKHGDRVTVDALRGDRRMSFQLPIQP